MNLNYISPLRGTSKIARWLMVVPTLILSLDILVGCATPYQPMGALGGYQEEQLAPDIYRVAFFGNGYTNPQTAAEYVIHRCAELTEQRGYRYFGILAVSDQSITRSFTTPAHAYTTGTGYATAIGNTAFGNYHSTTYYTPAQTIRFNFPRPVITIKMLNAWPKGANLVDASSVLSIQMAGLPVAPIQAGPLYSGPRMALDERTKERIISFVERFVASAQSDNTGPSPLTFYGPNVSFNGKPVTHEFIQRQLDTSSRIFPQRSVQIVSGPIVTPAPDSPGARVNYDISGVLSNGLVGMQVKGTVQLTVEKHGDQFEIVAIWPRVLEHHLL
jgi:hypothetical protein